MPDRIFYACKDHAEVAFKALMDGTEADPLPDGPLPGDSLFIDSRVGCGWCH